MGRWSLALLVYAALFAACSDDDNPPPNVDDGGTTDDASMNADDSGTPAGDTGVNDNDAGNNNGDAGNNNDAGTGIVDECNPVDQTGCTAPTTKCVVEGDDPGTQCEAPSPNDVGIGDPCTGLDCEAGLACIRDTGTATTAHCRTVCDLGTNAGCEPLGAEYECRTRITDSNWGTCTMLPPICDPYTQDPCPQDQACQPFLRRAGTWEFRCRTAGQAGEGMMCGSGTGCQRGLACVNDNTTGMTACKRYCQDDGDCTAPETCSRTVSDPPFMFCAQ